MAQRQSSSSGSASRTFLEDQTTVSVRYNTINNNSTASLSYDEDADTSTPPITISYQNGNAIWQANGRSVTLPANVAAEALAAIQAVSANNNEADMRSVANFALDPINNHTRWQR